MLHRRKSLLLLISICPFILLSLEQSSLVAHIQIEDSSPVILQQAADFTIQDVDTRDVFTLNDFRGSIVVLDLFATWCPPCQISIPYLRQIHTSYSRSEVQIISVDVDPEETQAIVSQFRDDENMDWIVSLDPDGTINSLYGKSSIPTFYIIDQEGNIEWSGAGFSETETWPTMESTIEQLLDEGPNPSGNPGQSPAGRAFLIILEVGAGIAVVGGLIVGVPKLQQRLRRKNCLSCNAVAGLKCSKCGNFVCSNCSVKGCPNCKSKKFVRL